MSKVVYVSLISCFLVSSCSYAAVRYVPSEYATIQQAIDYCVAGDTVVLASGTYIGAGNRHLEFRGKAITVRSEDPNDSAVVASTIIDCEESGAGLFFVSGERADSVLSGLTIIHARENGAGGILIRDSSPTILKCTVRSGFEGIRVIDGAPIIRDCVISNNVRRGIYCEGGSPVIINCDIRGNSIPPDRSGGIMQNGAGICIIGGEATVFRCSVVNNTTGKRGGGIYLEKDGYDILITHCIITGNHAVSDGGMSLRTRNGHADFSNSKFRIMDCLIAGNSANSGSGGLSAVLCEAEMSNCIISGNRLLLGGSGGGMSVEYGAIVDIHQCTIVGNIVGQESPGVDSIGGGLCLRRSEVNIANSIIRQNRAVKGAQLAIYAWNGQQSLSDAPTNIPTLVTFHHNDVNSEQDQDIYIYGDPNLLVMEMDNNIDADPFFASAGWWDTNGTSEEHGDDVWMEGDYHLQSQAGRWDNMVKDWVTDDVTSPCIDTGDPCGPIGLEPFPNGGYANMGAYALTEEASKSYFGGPPCEAIIAGDINGDCHVDFKDLQILVNNWLVPISN